MGGGGKQKVKETAAQKAAADVARKQWDLYQSDFKQFEDNFIERVSAFNSATNMADVKQAVDVGYNKAYTKSRDETAQSLSASGINPNSGKFQSTMANMATDQALDQSDTTNRAQSSEQDKYLAGLSDVTAIGLGQKTGALEGIGDVANTSLRKATEDAEKDFNKRSSNLQLAGAAAGVGLRSYMGQSAGSLGKAGVDGVSTKASTLNDYDPLNNPSGSLVA
ncbi:hypothetical protein [Salinivibrio proteolyticus]|uniref:DNA transfer protein n=1 Tax=Salinivibrio proteolyticus TaxID=334715 RepID=A0ABY7LC71_9GAMM|nr:hypothetical protein [Salinivibrio proteolyticus]WBA13837.1 hypothetical protein N7E60_08845 [Salinivibrio proteolyticus]